MQVSISTVRCGNNGNSYNNANVHHFWGNSAWGSDLKNPNLDFCTVGSELQSA